MGRRTLPFKGSSPIHALAPASPTLGSPLAVAIADATRDGDAVTVLATYRAAQLDLRELLVDTIVHTVGPSRPRWIDELIDHENTAAFGLLLRGCHRARIAFSAHGALADHVQVEQFHRLLKVAETDLLHAAAQDPTDPSPWSVLLSTGRGLGLERPVLLQRFDRACPTGTWLPLPHHHMIQVLSENWLGEPGEAIDFARMVASVAPLGSSLHDLIPAAHLEAAWTRRRRGRRIATTLAGAGDEILLAAQRSVEQLDYDDRDLGIMARNIFALALTLIGSRRRALAQFERIADRVSPYPWKYFGDPADEFLRFARLAAS